MEIEQILSIFNSLPLGIGVYAIDGTLIQFNDSFCKLLGTNQEQLKKTLLNINDSPSVPPEVKNAVASGTPISIEFSYDFHKLQECSYYDSTNGSICYFKCNGQPIVDATGKRTSYYLVIENITESVERKAKLCQSRRKAEMAMTYADVMLWEFDTQKQLFYSDNDPLNGFDGSHPITPQMYLDTIHPDDLSENIENMRKMRQGENFSFNTESRFLFPNNPEWQPCVVTGSPYEFAPDGKVLKYVGARKNNARMYRKQQLLNKILNAIPLSIHIKDVENDYRYLFCNDESKRMFGTGEGATAYDVMDVEEVARIQKTDLEVYNTGIPYQGLERVVLKNGRSHDTIVSKHVIIDEGRRMLLNIRWDQSLQNELKRQAQLFAVTLKTMDAYTWFFEPDKNRVSFDASFDKGKRRSQELNTVEKFIACLHPDDRQLFVDTLHRVVDEKEELWDVETRIDFEGTGNYEWWETRGVLETSILNDAPYRYMFGMTINIHSHKHAEITLRKNQEKMDMLIQQNELVLNNTNSGLAYIDTNYMVQWENVSLCSKSLSHEAYKKGELCYKSAHNRTSPCEDCVMERAMKSHQTEQIKFDLDDNHVFEIFATPILQGDGTVDGIVIRMDDVTERERMISELKDAKRHAEESDKLKSAFLANMSHEIRTPLNAIVGFSEMMRHAEDEEEKEEYVEIINTNNELLLKLISDILDLSKLEAGSVELKYEEFDLSSYFDNLAASMKQRVTNPEVSLLAINPYPSCKVLLDKNRLAQVLTNYVTNAIKYTPKGLIEMGYSCTEGGIYFYVKDSGIGIQDEKKSRVFQRFEKLDEFAQGTGLGLSICKAIVEAMGGRVGFETEYGHGSTFWASLPCEADITLEPEKKVSTEEEIGIKKGVASPAKEVDSAFRQTILVAEDIQSNFLLVSVMLKDKYNLLHAENGQEAVDMVRKGGIDLLFMDMKMPVMNGLVATAEIRKFNTQLPIIALTAHAFEADRLAALSIGCTEYLVKPIDKAKLVAALQKHL